jgi:hypothetical protein
VTPPVTVTVAPVKLEPVMVTGVAPSPPDAGEMPVMVGGPCVTVNVTVLVFPTESVRETVLLPVVEAVDEIVKVATTVVALTLPMPLTVMPLPDTFTVEVPVRFVPVKVTFTVVPSAAEVVQGGTDGVPKQIDVRVVVRLLLKLPWYSTAP